jgi:phosphate transport system ATP-binding protein
VTRAEIEAPPPAERPAVQERGLSAENVSVFYDGKAALRDVSLSVRRGEVTAVLGPSGCGKTTFLTALNRLVETVPGARAEGRVLLDGVDILSAAIRSQAVRRRVGLIFQKPNPFPLTVFENVALGLREHGLADKHALAGRVEEALRGAGLWEEVRDRLNKPALALSGGQQQRLCIARAAALRPDVILMDEPCSALDPVSTARVEELIRDLSRRHAVLVVTHNLGQARRVSAFAAFFYAEGGCGRLWEKGPTERLFADAERRETRDYLAGRTG